MFCGIKSYNTYSNAACQHWHSHIQWSFCDASVALSKIRCSKSAQKSTVQVCQVATVVMETTQLFLSQFKTFYSMNWELCNVVAMYYWMLICKETRRFKLDKCIMYSEHNSADGELSQTVRHSELSHSDRVSHSDRQQHSQHTVIYGH